MDRDKVQKIIIDVGGVARTADFNAAGFANYAVAEMCKQGLIVRVLLPGARKRRKTRKWPEHDQHHQSSFRRNRCIL